MLSPSQVSNNGDHGKAATSPGIKLTNSGYPTLSSGQKFHLTWTGDGSVSTSNHADSVLTLNQLVEIVLKEGTSGSLFTVQTLASAATGESADVTIPAGLKTGEYAFEIKQSGFVSDTYPSLVNKLTQHLQKSQLFPAVYRFAPGVAGLRIWSRRNCHSKSLRPGCKKPTYGFSHVIRISYGVR